MKPRVFILSEVYFPDDSATGYVLTHLAEGLAPFYDVHVLCGRTARRATNTRTTVREERRGVTIERCATTFFDKNIVMLRFINLVTICLSIFLKALFTLKQGDVVIVVTNPPPLPFVALLAARIRHAHSALLVHDVYPEVLVATGLLREDSFLVRALRWVNKRLYPRFERVIVLGRDMQQLVECRFMPENKKTVIVTNWADIETISPKPRQENRLLKQLGIEGKVVFQYSGNMGRTHGLETILEAAVLLEREESIHFLLIGSGAKRHGVETYLAGSRLKNVTLLPLQPRQELTDTLNACDVAIISFIKGIAGISVPSRMYNIMAAGKPIIAVADDASELALVVREENIGWVVRPGDKKALADAIQNAQSAPRKLKELGERARTAAMKYSRFHVLESYRCLIDSFLPDRLELGPNLRDKVHHV
ncbi:MAG: glycosyltransferase family 4 protein [Ignavibacteria bacterium]|nr:glycosyltransferase family 4 protein [Ignavibacteria bacterium]